MNKNCRSDKQEYLMNSDCRFDELGFADNINKEIVDLVNKDCRLNIQGGKTRAQDEEEIYYLKRAEKNKIGSMFVGKLQPRGERGPGKARGGGVELRNSVHRFVNVQGVLLILTISNCCNFVIVWNFSYL